MTLSSQFGLQLTSFCDSLEKETVGRCIKVFRFEPHPRKKILLLVGEVTVTIVKPVNGNVERQWSEEFKKRIHLLSLSHSTKTGKLVKEILTSCPYIDESMRLKLEETVEELKQRDYDQNGVVVHSHRAADGSFLPRYPEIFDVADQSEEYGNVVEEQEPDFNKLDQYIEYLYEDIGQKIEASKIISKLTKSNTFLRDIACHDSAVNALFRTLREDCKKSSTLTRNLLNITLDFARVQEFQAVLIKHKIPQLTLDIVDYELERCEKWKAHMTILGESVANQDNNSSSAAKGMSEYQVMFAKMEELISCQNLLLRDAFEVLHCVAEQPPVLETLLGQRILSSLLDALDRKHNGLLEVILNFLKDLSALKQCTNDLLIGCAVDKLAKLLKGGVPLPRKIVHASLHFLYNLTFHGTFRESIVRTGLISVIANCYDKSSFQPIVGKILYVLSMETNTRSKLAKPSILAMLMTKLTSSADEAVPIEMVSLAVNLARNKKCAELMWETNKVGLLVHNGLKNEDFLAMKIVRNLIEQDTGFVLYEAVDDIAKSIVHSVSQEFVTECIGTLASFDPEKVSVEQLTQKRSIFPWLKQTLNYSLEDSDKGAFEASLHRSVIDVIQLLTNISKVEEGARLLVGEGFADILLKLLYKHRTENNSEIVKQILYYFNKSAEHESISIFFAIKTHIPRGLLEIVVDATGLFKHLIESVLERIAVFDDNWKENLQQYNFSAWNKDWMDAIFSLEAANDPNQLRDRSLVQNAISLEELGAYGSGLPQIKALPDPSGLSDSECVMMDGSETLEQCNTTGDMGKYLKYCGHLKHKFDEKMSLYERKNRLEPSDVCLTEEELGEDSFLYDSESDTGWEHL